MWLDKATRLLEGPVKKLSWITNGLGVGILMVMMFLTVGDVCLRYFLSRPIPGAYELNEFMLVVVVFLGLAHTALKQGHVIVGILVSRLPLRIRAGLDVLTNLLGLVFFALVTWRAVVQTKVLWLSNTKSGVLSIPSAPFVFIVAFGSGILCMVLFLNILKSLVKGLSK